MNKRRAAWFAIHSGPELPFDIACAKIGENKAKISVKKGEKHNEVTVTVFSKKLLEAVDKVNISLKDEEIVE